MPNIYFLLQPWTMETCPWEFVAFRTTQIFSVLGKLLKLAAMADCGPVVVMLLTPGLIFQLPGISRVVEFNNFQTSGVSICVHSLIFFGLITIFLIDIGVRISHSEDFKVVELMWAIDFSLKRNLVEVAFPYLICSSKKNVWFYVAFHGDQHIENFLSI